MEFIDVLIMVIFRLFMKSCLYDNKYLNCDRFDLWICIVIKVLNYKNNVFYINGFILRF